MLLIYYINKSWNLGIYESMKEPFLHLSAQSHRCRVLLIGTTEVEMVSALIHVHDREEFVYGT
jgi:hypothetical protein